MTEIHDLLARAVDDPIDVDTTADLRRGRRALNRRRTRIAAGVTGGLVAVGAGGSFAVPRHQNAVMTIDPADAPTSAAPVVHTTYYQVPEPPAGWHVVGERPQYVMISRDGTDTTVDSSFIGQIIVGLEDGQERFDKGPSVQHGGRTFYVNDGNPGVTILSVRTSPGGPWLQAQYPNADLGQIEMVAFLDGVVVGPDAAPAVG
jgi:hypothetical protein